MDPTRPGGARRGVCGRCGGEQPDVSPGRGRPGIETSFASLFRVFPDWEMSFEEPCISNNRAMQACRVAERRRGTSWASPAPANASSSSAC